MSAYEFIKETVREQREQNPIGGALWKYKGPGFGQRLLHVIGLLEPYEVVTCSAHSGWLGSCEDFLKQFEIET